jgi:glycosyltransferase involved in cell wall biosynthesis
VEKTDQSAPLVSAVIPTRNRPMIVCRAVLCVLRQTHPNVEAVVVIDGPDQATVTALEALADPRVRIVALPENVGGSEARNRGVQEARGDWIAFLDDDDEWLPEKIQKQLTVALNMPMPLTFVACRFVDRDRFGERVLPAIIGDLKAPFSEFLLCRTGMSGGSSYVQTSTWLVSRQLAQQCQFTPGLKRNQDLDWMLRAMSIPEARFALVTEPLVVFNSVQMTGRVSKIADWEFHFEWAMRRREYFSRKALTYFLSTVCVEDAARQNKRLSASRALVSAICLYGTPSVKSWLFFAYYLLISETCRQRLRSAIAAARKRNMRNLTCD